MNCSGLTDPEIKDFCEDFDRHGDLKYEHGLEYQIEALNVLRPKQVRQRRVVQRCQLILRGNVPNLASRQNIPEQLV